MKFIFDLLYLDFIEQQCVFSLTDLLCSVI